MRKGVLYVCLFIWPALVILEVSACLLYVLNNALCFVSKPPPGSFYGKFLLEEDISLLEKGQVVALL